MATSNKKVPKIKKFTVPEKEVEKVNKDVHLQKVIINRDLKYIYPKGCTDTLERKKYRAKIRNKIEKLTAKVALLKGKERVEAKTVLDAYRAEHLVKA